LKSDGALDQLREMTMTTHTRILSSLALTAAMLVTVSSDAFAKSGGARSGGMRSVSVARPPTVSSKVRTTSGPVSRAKLLETKPGAGTIKIIKEKPKEKHKVIIVHRRHPIYLPAVIGAAPAAVAVDPPGCTYERRVRKLPGGGRKRVIVKVCPDA
jgi:hypothetical protein